MGQRQETNGFLTGLRPPDGVTSKSRHSTSGGDSSYITMPPMDQLRSGVWSMEYHPRQPMLASTMDTQHGPLPNRAALAARRAQKLDRRGRCRHTPLPSELLIAHSSQATDHGPHENKTSINFLLNTANTVNLGKVPTSAPSPGGSLLPPFGGCPRQAGAKVPYRHDQKTFAPAAHRDGPSAVQLSRRNAVTNLGSPSSVFDASTGDTIHLKFTTEARGFVRPRVRDQLLLQSVGKPWKIRHDENAQRIKGSTYVPITITFPHPPGSKLEEILRDALESRLFSGMSQLRR